MVYYAIDGTKGAVTGEHYNPYPDAKHAYISYGWTDVPPGTYTVTITPSGTPVDLSKYRHYMFGIGYYGPAPEEGGFTSFNVTLSGTVHFNGIEMSTLTLSGSTDVDPYASFGYGDNSTIMGITKLFEFSMSGNLDSLKFTATYTSSSSGDYQGVDAFVLFLRNIP